VRCPFSRLLRITSVLEAFSLRCWVPRVWVFSPRSTRRAWPRTRTRMHPISCMRIRRVLADMLRDNRPRCAVSPDRLASRPTSVHRLLSSAGVHQVSRRLRRSKDQPKQLRSLRTCMPRWPNLLQRHLHHRLCVGAHQLQRRVREHQRRPKKLRVLRERLPDWRQLLERLVCLSCGSNQLQRNLRIQAFTSDRANQPLDESVGEGRQLQRMATLLIPTSR
jgi:hypothetical protein